MEGTAVENSRELYNGTIDYKRTDETITLYERDYLIKQQVEQNKTKTSGGAACYARSKRTKTETTKQKLKSNVS